MHTITTDRLLLKPLTEQDKPLYLQLYTNPKVMRKICSPLSESQAEQFFNLTLKQVDRFDNKRLSWAIVEKESQKTIGIQGITWDKNLPDTVSIGIMLLPAANGRLYPEEAMGALVQYAFEYANLTQVNAEFNKTNFATARFVKKLGFILTQSKSSVESSNNIPQTCYITQKHLQSNLIVSVS